MLARFVLAAALAPSCAAAASDVPSPSPAAQPAQAKPFRVERYDWSGTLELSAALRRLVVRNDYGDVRARFAGDGLANLHAVIQRLGSGPDVGVNVERHGDTLVVAVVSPPGRVSVDQARLPKTAVDRVDLVVYVPPQAALDAESARGLVEARGLQGDVRAVTVDGEIRVSASTAVEARSEGGAVTVNLAKLGEAPTRIESRTGAIRLALPADGDFRLQVETGGELKTAFELQPGERVAGRRRASASFGKAWQSVTVRSESGNIELVRAR